MVMTLRKRAAPPPSRSPSTSPPKSTRRKTNPTSSSLLKVNMISSTSDSDSDSDSDSRSEEEEEEENGYEKAREQRIRENKERLNQLGISSLSSSLFTSLNKRVHPPPKPIKKRPPPLSPSYRRSSRLKNVPKANYVGAEGSLEGMGITLPDDWTSEAYTDEDLKLLGNCKAEWTLNVDGFGEDGERLYDPISGTSCHQCRQKTLSKHTFCGKCRLPQGRICGDCLYTRYGENVLETSENPTWVCPACRGICNCSRCRRAKGWQPANILYQKVIESGYKSVAHYLLHVRRAGAMSKESKDGTVVADPAEETQVKVRYEGSDSSAESSESESDYSDDDSKAVKRSDIESDVVNMPAAVCVVEAPSAQ